MKAGTYQRVGWLLPFMLSALIANVSMAASTPNENASVKVNATQAQEATSAIDDQAIDEADIDVPDSGPPITYADPFEPFNRTMFRLNETLDKYLFNPISFLYNKIMPKPLNQGIHNFFNNLNTVPTIANDVLQLHFTQMLNDVWRLGINTTLGVGGLFDVASRIKLPRYANDFGLTLGRWGWANSNYLVLPIFGPNTIREAIEIPVDYFAFSVYPYIEPPWRQLGLLTLAFVDKKAQIYKFESVMQEAAIDKYVFLRSAYMQSRANQIAQNKSLGLTGRYCGESMACVN